MAEEKSKRRRSTALDVQEAWDRAIEDFEAATDWEKFVAWCGKYAPDLEERAERYQRMEIRGRFLVNRLVRQAFRTFRKEYRGFEANLGIAMAANSQAFSFTKVVDGLCDGS